LDPVGIQPKMLDPDPDEMNADPKPWFLLYKILFEYAESNEEHLENMPKESWHFLLMYAKDLSEF
jgi:hypothetical protein